MLQVASHAGVVRVPRAPSHAHLPFCPSAHLPICTRGPVDPWTRPSQLTCRPRTPSQARLHHASPCAHESENNTVQPFAMAASRPLCRSEARPRHGPSPDQISCRIGSDIDPSQPTSGQGCMDRRPLHVAPSVLLHLLPFREAARVCGAIAHHEASARRMRAPAPGHDGSGSGGCTGPRSVPCASTIRAS
jgi:hypothetical protein